MDLIINAYLCLEKSVSHKNIKRDLLEQKFYFQVLISAVCISRNCWESNKKNNTLQSVGSSKNSYAHLQASVYQIC